MDTKLRVVQYGCGKISKYLMKYVFDNGGEIVAALDERKNLEGKDIGEIIECEAKGIRVSSSEKAESIFKKLKPDACIIATAYTSKEIEEILLLCAKNGVNVIHTCEEGIYQWSTSLENAMIIDKAAKESNCTIMCCKYYELYLGNLISILSGGISNISKISIRNSYNIEDYNDEFAKCNGVGISKKEVEGQIHRLNKLNNTGIKGLSEEERVLPNYMWYQNHWICVKLNLKISREKYKFTSEIAKEDLISKKKKNFIKAGEVKGMRGVISTETDEGILIETEYVGRVYTNGEYDRNQLMIEGSSIKNIVLDNASRMEVICSIIVNLLPQLINWEAGFICTHKLPSTIYLSKALNAYVK